MLAVQPVITRGWGEYCLRGENCYFYLQHLILVRLNLPHPHPCSDSLAICIPFVNCLFVPLFIIFLSPSSRSTLQSSLTLCHKCCWGVFSVICLLNVSRLVFFKTYMCFHFLYSQIRRYFMDSTLCVIHINLFSSPVQINCHQYFPFVWFYHLHTCTQIYLSVIWWLLPFLHPISKLFSAPF